jgi:PPK2 family polyphosphate:nucleotide phosphotransferase
MIKLNNQPTKTPKDIDEDDIRQASEKLYARIGELQQKMYAQKKHSLLIILQGMDATGKDGITTNVFSKCSATGVRYFAFKAPTKDELAHDFLWRIHPHTPAKGELMIFNRSHYEDVLIQRVHQWIDQRRLQTRLKAINAFETLLRDDNNTTILKFYLHISEERQQEKLQERIDEREKNWKHNAADWDERKLWNEYMEAYEDAINTCNEIPWHIIPCDQRWYRNYSVAKIVLDTLEQLNPEYPTLPDDFVLPQDAQAPKNKKD